MTMEQRRRRRPLTRQEQLTLQERKQHRQEKMEESRELARGPIDVTFCLLVLLLTAIGLVMLLFGAGRHAKGFGKVTAALSCIYNTLTGWFGDILSYSRIMALMLAGSVVAQVFNTIAAMPAQSSGANVLTMLAFIVIFLIGHALNFALNLLGCFVHDLRLQCLEFFGKFYEGGGREFAPFSAETHYFKPQSKQDF